MIAEANKCKEKELREPDGKMGCMMLQRGTAAACHFKNFAVVVLVTDQPRNVTVTKKSATK